MGMLLALKILALCAVIVEFPEPSTGRRLSYHGHRLLRIIPQNEETLQFLNELVTDDHYLMHFQLDFWTLPARVSHPVDIHVSRHRHKEFERLLTSKNIKYSVRVRNIQRLVNMERTRPRFGGSFDSQFNSYKKIVAEMTRLERVNKSIVTLFSLGKTYEGRKIYALKISANRSRDKPIFFINCGIHSREWISISTCMYIARRLVESYSSDSQVRRMIERHEWVILPVVNVDGYIYTHNRDRMWRKNKNPGGEQARGCMGTDLNRNFNFHWGGIGSAPNKACSPIYPGARPFSEVETRNVARYLYRNRKRLQVYIDFHSYGQLWMSPWGFTKKLPPNYEKHAVAMKAIVNAIKHVHGTKFTYGPSSIMIYPTSGDATDWTFGVLGVTHSYGVELRPGLRDLYGFFLPPSSILPVGKETFQGLKALTEIL